MTDKTLKLFKESTDLANIRERRSDVCGDRAFLLTNGFLVLTYLVMISVILLSGSILGIYFLDGLLLLIPFAMITCGVSYAATCIAELVGEHQVPRLERRVYKKIGWHPRYGSYFAPLGTHDHCVIERSVDENKSSCFASRPLCLGYDIRGLASSKMGS